MFYSGSYRGPIKTDIYINHNKVQKQKAHMYMVGILKIIVMFGVNVESRRGRV